MATLGDKYKADCAGGTGGPCTQPDCEVCWPDVPREAMPGDIYPLRSCAGCPWDVGDIHERDCAFPDCAIDWKPTL